MLSVTFTACTSSFHSDFTMLSCAHDKTLNKQVPRPKEVTKQAETKAKRRAADQDSEDIKKWPFRK